MFLFIFFIFLLILILGVLAFLTIFHRNSIDSFYCAATVVTGLSIECAPTNDEQKIFLTIYVTLSIGIYLLLVAGLIAYLIDW